MDGVSRQVARPRGPYQLRIALLEDLLAYASCCEQVKVAMNAAIANFESSPRRNRVVRGVFIGKSC